MGWRHDLLRLHTKGWDADDIDDACEALHEACDDGAWKGLDVDELTVEQMRSVLRVDLDRSVLLAIRTIASLRRRQIADADDLRRALYDLDAFAFTFTRDD